jgi:hypothetical protein
MSIASRYIAELEERLRYLERLNADVDLYAVAYVYRPQGPGGIELILDPQTVTVVKRDTPPPPTPEELEPPSFHYEPVPGKPGVVRPVLDKQMRVNPETGETTWGPWREPRDPS